jgi:hypothetical protein
MMFVLSESGAFLNLIRGVQCPRLTATNRDSLAEYL